MSVSWLVSQSITLAILRIECHRDRVAVMYSCRQTGRNRRWTVVEAQSPMKSTGEYIRAVSRTRFVQRLGFSLEYAVVVLPHA